jgi:hypothetical protein
MQDHRDRHWLRAAIRTISTGFGGGDRQEHILISLRAVEDRW